MNATANTKYWNCKIPRTALPPASNSFSSANRSTFLAGFVVVATALLIVLVVVDTLVAVQKTALVEVEYLPVLQRVHVRSVVLVPFDRVMSVRVQV